MNSDNKRKHARIEATSLISQEMMNEDGIRFIGSENEIKEFAVSLVKLHHHRKYETYVKVAA